MRLCLKQARLSVVDIALVFNRLTHAIVPDLARRRPLLVPLTGFMRASLPAPLLSLRLPVPACRSEPRKRPLH
jgi:hypothetical protein